MVAILTVYYVRDLRQISLNELACSLRIMTRQRVRYRSSGESAGLAGMLLHLDPALLTAVKRLTRLIALIGGIIFAASGLQALRRMGCNTGVD